MDQSKRTIGNVLILAMDLVSITCSMILAYFLRYHILLGRHRRFDQAWVLAVMWLLFIVVFYMAEAPERFYRRGYFEELVEVVKANGMAMILFLIVLFLMHISYQLSRLVLGRFLVCNIILMYVGRTALKKYMTNVYRKSSFSSSMLLVAASGDAERILRELLSYHEWYRDITGIVLTDDAPLREIGRIPVVCRLGGLLDYAISHQVDEIYFSHGTAVSEDIFHGLVTPLEEMGVIVDINIDEFERLETGKKSLGRVGKYAVVVNERNRFSAKGLLLKRLLDIVGSLVGMIILGVVTIFLAPAIKLDSPGPVFFTQTRVGKNGRKFKLYKFRSMYIDAEARKAELMDENEVKGLMFKMEDDPRITKVGKFIRRTSLDELPQFWNILKGDMSLVGTRPPTVDEYEQYEAKHKSRLSMTPGLTGMWQISGRSDITDFDEVVRLDMEYIDNWTIKKDIKILLLTVKVVLTGKGSR